MSNIVRIGHVVTIQKQIDLSTRLIKDLLTTAEEGGSDFWIHSVRGSSIERVVEGSGSRIYTISEPFDEGGQTKFPLDWLRIRLGLNDMAGYYSSRKYCEKFFEAMLNESWDVDSADEFLQHILFGELVFG